MLFKRYSNPLELLKTFTFGSLADFILYMFDQENEDTLFEIWLHKESERDFPTFKKAQLKSVRKSKPNINTKEYEKNVIEAAARFIKPRKKGGD